MQKVKCGIYTTDFQNEYVSLTDIAKYRSIEPRITIHNWLRGRDIVEFLGLWEALHNPNFKRIDFDAFKEDAGSNAFVSIKKWNEEMGAIGLITNPDDTAAEFMLIWILLWNLHLGFHRNLSYI